MFPEFVYERDNNIGVVYVIHRGSRFWVRDDMAMDLQRDGLHDWVVDVVGVDNNDAAHVVDVIVDGVIDHRPE